MRKIIATALAAVTLGGAMAAAATPASAQGRYYDGGRYRDHGRGRNDSGDAIVAGIAGLAIGAALAGSRNNAPAYGYGGGYPPPAYGYGYGPRRGPAYGYRTCERRERVYDPYMGRNVVVTSRYAC